MTLEKWRYKDPLDVLLSEEAQTCAGCVNDHTMTLMGETLGYCGIGMLHSSRGGHRCKRYIEREDE